MQLLHVYIGSWFPKTAIHMDELADFLLKRNTQEGLDPKTVKQLYRTLAPVSVERGVNALHLNFIAAESGTTTYRYCEDGVVLLKKEAHAKIAPEIASLISFYDKKLSPSLSYLYGRGAKGLEILRHPGQHKRAIVTVYHDTLAAIAKLFASVNDTIETTEGFTHYDLYTGTNLQVVALHDEHSENNIDCLVEYLILISESRRHFQKLLNLHRSIWDQAEEINNSKSNNAPVIQGQVHDLTDLANLTANIDARIDQMTLNIGFREHLASNGCLASELVPALQRQQQNLAYLNNLFIMNKQNVDADVQQLQTRYENNQQESLNTLQFLFLISVITSFLALGNMPTTADINLYDTMHKLIARGDMANFDVMTLVYFGSITLAITSLVYFTWNFFYNRPPKKKPLKQKK